MFSLLLLLDCSVRQQDNHTLDRQQDQRSGKNPAERAALHLFGGEHPAIIRADDGCDGCHAHHHPIKLRCRISTQKYNNRRLQTGGLRSGFWRGQKNTLPFG